MDTQSLGKWILVVGIVLAAVGGLLWLFGRMGIPLGRLPGDLHLGGERWSVHFPVVTCIVLSIVLTVILNLVARFFR
ncbi:MAG: DUF2905 domain-containing protein [Planctomycetota bacterium]|nr:MAG: DUF2905 domain-containing protein [Planctomycetota bacterium]